MAIDFVKMMGGSSANNNPKPVAETPKPKIDFVKMMSGTQPVQQQPILPRPVQPPVNQPYKSLNPLLSVPTQIPKQPVNFGLNLKPVLPTPSLNVASPARQTVTPAPLVAPQPILPKPPVNPQEIIDRGKDQIIRQATMGEAIPPIKNNPIRDALFGDPKKKAILRDMQRRGIEPGFFSTWGTEGFWSLTGRDKEQQKEGIYYDLVEKGIDPNRATEISYNAIESRQGLNAIADDLKSNDASKRERAAQRLDELNLTTQEKVALGLQKAGQLAGTALEATDLLTFGTTKPIKKAIGNKVGDVVSKIASNMTAEDADILRNMYRSSPERGLNAQVIDKEASVVKGMGLDKVPDMQRKQAVEDILTAYDNRWAGVDEMLNPPAPIQRGGAMDIKKPVTTPAKEIQPTPKPKSESVSSDNLTTDYKGKEFHYVYNSKKANLLGDFAQDIEPAGRYMNIDTTAFKGGEGMVTGKVTFKNPLVIDFKSTDRTGWKADIQNKYGGKTGHELSQSIIDDGYDGVITIAKDIHGKPYPKEVVNLQSYKSPITKKKGFFQALKEMTPAERQGGYFGNKPKQYKVESKAAKSVDEAEKIQKESKVVARTEEAKTVRNVEKMKTEAKKEPVLPKPVSKNIKINAEIKDIRQAIKNKEMNAEKIGELATRINVAEESIPALGKLRQVMGRNTDDTLQQIQASAMKKVENNPIAKDMSLTEAERILKSPKDNNAKTLEAARLVRRANLDSIEGFNSLDEAQKALEDFNRIKEDVSSMRSELKPAKAERALANKASSVASTVSAERRSYVKFLQDQFQLTDAEIKKLTFGRDLQRMGESEFNGFIRGLENRAVQAASTKQAKWELAALLEDKHFVKVENYRKAQKLPTIANMSEAQLRQYAKALEGFNVGDEFLSPRTLETISRTELGNVSTMRQVRTHLWEELKKNPEFKDIKLSDLENMTSNVLDNMRYDTALAEKNPFYNLVVNRTQTEMMRGKASFLKIQEETNRLTKAANASRKRGVLGSLKQALVPKQSEIVKYLEAEPGAKKAAMEALTKEELDLAVHMEQYYRGALDHLIAIEELRGSRYADAYFTHTKKQFLEKWSDDGLISAVRNVFQAQKDTAQVAQIIDQDTGQILSKSKFFKYTLRRTGEGEASNNATKVFLDYVQQMERKKMLDRIIPEIDVYTQSLTPPGTTKKGLELDRSLKTFINKYLNNKKGRRENFGGLVAQGGKLDVALRLGNTFVSLKDLGGNVFASAATFVGEFVMAYQGLGKAGMARAIKRRLWDTGAMRLLNPNATKILKEAEPFLGRNVWTEIMEPNMALTDKALTGIFSPFSQASVESNKLFLLGKLTKEEVLAGKLSPQKLAELRLEAGRWRDMGSEVKSIYGATSGGATLNKYKGWAIPIARTNISNLTKLAERLKSGNFKGTLTSREFQETYRAIEMTTAIYFVGQHAMADVDEDTFLGKLYARIQLEAMTIMGGIDPTLFVSTPRLASFAIELAKNLKSLVTLEEYTTSGNGYEKGDIKAINALQRQFTPAALKQFTSSGQKTPEQKLESKKREESKVNRERVQPIFDQVLKLKEEGKTEEANALVSEDNMSAEDYEVYKSIRASWRAEHTSTIRLKLELDPVDAVSYLRSLPKDEQTRILDLLSDEEYKQYESGKI